MLLKRARNMFGYEAADAEVISMYQKYIRSKVSSESCSRNGKLGYAATVAAGKGDVASNKAAEWRFDNPSDLEQIVISVCEELGLPTDRTYREVRIGKYYVDFKYGSIIIEVNDDTWHDNNASFKGDVESRDAKKYEYLRSEGFTVVILAEQAVRNGLAAHILTEMQYILKGELL